ncbi:nucleotidyltransferase family protein [Patescibacteria group bacterium]|nr:MAG: nucleotidyltransferase family protein [Patescibacteria group bacterium]
MQAVILAAGKGTRMLPLTQDIPKSMLPIQGKPILAYTLEFLPAKIDEVIIAINYLGEQIQKYFGDSFAGKKIRYVRQKELNGSGGAVWDCQDILQDRFLVLMGDDLYYRQDLEKLSQERLALLAIEVDDPTRFGIVQLDKDGNVTDIVEKPATMENRLANIGAYALTKGFFDYPLVPINGTEFGLPQTMLQMQDKHPIKVIRATHWQPVGYPDHLQQAEQELAKFIN